MDHKKYLKKLQKKLEVLKISIHDLFFWNDTFRRNFLTTVYETAAFLTVPYHLYDRDPRSILSGFPNVLNGLWLFGPGQRFLGAQARHQNQEKQSYQTWPKAREHTKPIDQEYNHAWNCTISGQKKRMRKIEYFRNNCSIPHATFHKTNIFYFLSLVVSQHLV